MIDISEIKQKTREELEESLLVLRKEQFNLRMKKANGALDKTHIVKKLRRAIARIKTVMTEKVG